MNKRAILHLIGSLEEGFQVLLEVRESSGTILTDKKGHLPAFPAVSTALDDWQTAYFNCLDNHRIGPINIVVKRNPQEQINHCRSLGESLESSFQRWLESPDFHIVDLHLRQSLNSLDDAQILVRADDRRIHRLPWHTWELLDHYRDAEILLGSPPELIPQPISQSKKVRILAILGDSTGINTQFDRQELQQLPQAEVRFLVEPSRQELSDRLWDQPWDILFFAGHSFSENQQGYLRINKTESLTIKELRFGLQKAIARGLQLAIFNSCHGLGMAYELEQLHIPQVVVMREPVPDLVAQEFLKNFLNAFSSGSPLHLALRRARERLQSSEDKFPYATWLPVLFQNPALPTATWDSLKRPDSWRDRLSLSLGLGVCTTIAVMGLRLLGLLQPAEFAFFDRLIRNRPPEPPDRDVVIVEVDQDDLTAERDRRTPAQLQGRSLSDETREALLAQLNTYDPALIGLDIYGDIPATLPALKQRLATTENLYTICKLQDPHRPASESYEQPSEVPDERVGFSDLKTDVDEIMRTQPLYGDVGVGSFLCTAEYSFSALLAFRWLEARGKPLEPAIEAEETWRWGKVAINPIGSSWLRQPGSLHPYGLYFDKETMSGHQIWLNYRATRISRNAKNPTDAFSKVKLRDVLAGNLNKKSFQDRIVLIGVTAPEAKDFWKTPYLDQDGQPLEIPGVYLHAQMISQIINAEQRPLLRAMPWAVDVLVIGMVAIALLFGLQQFTAQHRHLRWFAVLTGLALLLVYGGCRLVFGVLGVYLPFVPIAFSLLGGSLGVGLQRSPAAQTFRIS